MTPITIEPMRLEDLIDVLDIERAAFRTPWSREKLIVALRSTSVSCLVGRLGGGRLAGYVCLQRVGPAIDVVRLATHPDLRRRGVGRLLLAAVLEDARRRGVTRVVLQVRDGNVAARALYERLDFRAVGPYRYPDGASGLVMAKSDAGVAFEPAKDPAAPGGSDPHQAPPVAVKVPLKPAQEPTEPTSAPPSGDKAPAQRAVFTTVVR